MRFCAIVLLLLIGHLGAAQTPSTPGVRFDGLYQTKPRYDKKDKDTTYEYVRFYPSGKVLTVGSRGTANDLKRWFNLENTDMPVGQYELNGKRVSFSTSSRAGTVNYQGKLKSHDRLVLKWHSLINGKKARERYHFVAIAGLK